MALDYNHLMDQRSVRLQADRHGPAKAGHYVYVYEKTDATVLVSAP